MNASRLIRLVSFGTLLLLEHVLCDAEADEMWKLCPGVEHSNCDAALKVKERECGAGTVHSDTCGCTQDFINAYVK